MSEGRQCLITCLGMEMSEGTRSLKGAGSTAIYVLRILILYGDYCSRLSDSDVLSLEKQP